MEYIFLKAKYDKGQKISTFHQKRIECRKKVKFQILICNRQNPKGQFLLQYIQDIGKTYSECCFRHGSKGMNI